MKKTLTQHLKHLPPALVLLSDGLLFGLTDPTKVNSAVLVVAVLLLTANVFYLLRLVFWLCGLVGLPTPTSLRAQRYITGVALIIIALGSIGELTVRDVMVLVPLALLAYLYRTFANIRRADA